MRRLWTTIYASLCTLLLAGGFVAVFYFAWLRELEDIVKCLVGFLLGFVVAPVFHELGHVCCAHIAGMQCVYVKCFCVRVYTEEGKKRLALASPFAADQTQVLPKYSGDMQSRAKAYALGGLLFSGVLLAVIVACAILLMIFMETNYLLWAMLPYAGYLFLLNAMPLQYASGKTDALVYRGLKKGYPEEKNMLASMDIYGNLSEGKSFSQIDETLFFDLPQVCEDAPIYAVMLDLRYRYYLEKGEIDNAGKCLNRLVSIIDYLSQKEGEKVAAELVYMNALRGELDMAEENAKACQTFLKSETATAKRILAQWSKANGQTDFVKALLAQGANCLDKEKIAGVRKFEEILLSRIEA